MSFREKTAWISIVSIFCLMAWYFWPFLHAGQRRQWHLPSSDWRRQLSRS